MRIKLDKKNGKPLYIQLYNAISDEIRSGRLHNGAKLPPRREMAALLNISANTVDSAYKMLQDTGYVISIPRSGYIVSFKSMIYEPVVPWELNAPEEIVFSPNGIDFSHLNRAAYAKTVRSLVYNDGAEIFSYVDKIGEEALRCAISKYLYSFRNIKCSPDHIILGAGAEYLLTALSLVFSDDIPVIMENPCDPHFYQTLKAYNRKISLLPANAGVFDADALGANKKGLFLIDTYARFPRGTGLGSLERDAVLEWAAKGERYIIENGDRAELAPYSDDSLYSLDKNGKTIYFGSFSKSLSPAFKTSYMVLPEEILERWKRHHAYYYALSSKLEQYALAEFIEKGHFTKHYKAMKRIYKDKLEYFQSHLKSQFGNSITIHDDCGTFTTVSFKDRKLEDVKTLSRRNGVKLLSETSFCSGGETLPPTEDKIVFGIGDLSRNQIRRGVLLLKRALE